MREAALPVLRGLRGLPGRFWRDLSVDDIAERLGVAPGTVKSRLHYALKTLREAIEPSEEARR